MDIPQKIDAIIAERKKQLPKIASALERAVKAKQVVEWLDRFRTPAADGMNSPVQAMMQSNPELAEKMRNISTKEFYDQYLRTESLLRDLQKRFERDEVHISFVGQAGQGKSLVLQRISGLPGTIIPSSDGGDCTGAKSTISNSPGEETRAQITFYTEQEFIKIINTYLETIFKTSEYNIFSIDGLAKLESLHLRPHYTQVRETSLMNHLEKYFYYSNKDHAAKLREQLGRIITVPEAEIESYVAQYKNDEKNIKYYSYLAVKEARILSSFPYAQCGKIVLEDTIGIGATSLGVEDAMYATVKQDSDAIIYMLRPDPCRPRLAKEDYDTIEKIADVVSPEYAKQMLFWLINRVEDGKGQNAGQIPEIMSQLKRQDLPVAQYLNVNCWEAEDVESSLLLPVLSQMSEHLTEIDQLLLDRANEQVHALEFEYKRISSKIEGASGASINQDERREFRKTIQGTLEKMTDHIRNLYLREYGPNRSKPCAKLKDAASVKLKNIVLAVPKRDEVKDLLEHGTIHQYKALERLSDKIRIHIIDDFLDLNPVLHDLVLEMKRRVVHLMADEDEGRLSFLVNADADDPDRWLSVLQDKLDDPQFQTIRSAIKVFNEFDLTMENFLIYKVRSCLDPIDWSMRTNLPQISSDLADKDAVIDEIRFWLQHILEDVHGNVSKELENFYQFPNTALYAVVRDFYDRIINAGDGEVLTEWRYLYEDKIPIIWAAEDRKFKESQGMAEEWSNFTAAIYACAVDGYFMIQ